MAVYEMSLIGSSYTSPIQNDLPFELSIIHINDFHARFEETNELAGYCKANESCIGGYARSATVIKHLINTQRNSIYLNAGDSFQGTLWYTYGRWNVTSELFNLLVADATALGNHDFDDGIDGVVPFIETLRSPVVLTNVDDTFEPSFQNKCQRSLIIERDGRTIGIIGIILKDVDRLADTGNLKFLDEIIAIQTEAAKLKEQNVNIIIVVSHCGLAADYVIAKACAEDVDVIVGGHSHSLMYTMDSNGRTAPGPDPVVDNYPAVVRDGNGHTVLIVQAMAFSKYVGNLTVHFNRQGEAIRWEGAPIYLETSIESDDEIVEALQPWKQLIDNIGEQVVGKSDMPLEKVPCHSHECELGNIIADAFAKFYQDKEITSSGGDYDYRDTKRTRSIKLISFITCGTIHASLSAGSITFNDLRLVLPFENTVDTFELRGQHLHALFEHAVDASWRDDTFIGKWLLQVSGVRVIYNMTMPVNNRVVSIELQRNNALDAIEYEAIDHNAYYLCAAQSFLVAGGDGYDMIKTYKRNHRKGPADIDAILKYLTNHQISDRIFEGRLIFLD